MSTLRIVAALALLPLIVGGAASAQSPSGEAEAKEQAQAAAEDWLALTDAGKFEESWEASAELFQERIPEADWVQTGQKISGTVAALTSRQLVMAQYRDTATGAPGAGPFVVLKYRSTADGDRFQEVVMTVQEDENTWAVAGYQVTPLSEAGRDS